MASPPPPPFIPYEKMPEGTRDWDGRSLKAIKRWVVTEKIHGANFSFTTDGQHVTVAKRGGHLEPTEAFFGVWKSAVIDDNSARVRALMGIARRECSGAAALTVYGELFGGSYPAPGVAADSTATPVQTAVSYCPGLAFCAFDVAVQVGAEGGMRREYWSYGAAMRACRQVGILFAEPLLVGPLTKALAYPLGFDSTLPRRLGLPPLPSGTNKAEGVVIKPHDATNLIPTPKGPRRPILKRKLEDFAETRRRIHPEPAKASWACGPEQLLMYEAEAMMTQQRAVAAWSKVGGGDLGAVEESVAADVVGELRAEHGELWGRCGEEGRARVEAGVREGAGRLVAEWADGQRDIMRVGGNGS
eukprot:evm.model.scf_1526.6 EVM.evm.TU.scf_1526.6   scf_1526:37916-39341(-)